MPSFNLIPVLNLMESLYRMPLDQSRFKQYLYLLNGNKKDCLELPIQGFNPMARPHVLKVLLRLKTLNIEKIIFDTIKNIQVELETEFRVTFNLSDDIKGGWTNRYSTDFDSKFKIQGLVKHKFVTPYFWVSEDIDEDLIRNRTLEYCFRTMYFLEHSTPKRLRDFVEQERYVYRKLKYPVAKINNNDLALANQFYKENQDSEDYNLIFNFLYGHDAAESLKYKSLNFPNDLGWYYISTLI